MGTASEQKAEKESHGPHNSESDHEIGNPTECALMSSTKYASVEKKETKLCASQTQGEH